MKRYILPLMSFALLVSAPALAIAPGQQPAQEASQTSTLTQAKTEKALFAVGLQQAEEALHQADYDAAEGYLNAARHWVLALSDSLVTESSPYSWDDLRQMEFELLNAYERLGRHYQMVGRYDRAVLTAREGLLLNPHYAPLREQQQRAFVALLSF